MSAHHTPDQIAQVKHLIDTKTSELKQFEQTTNPDPAIKTYLIEDIQALRAQIANDKGE